MQSKVTVSMQNGLFTYNWMLWVVLLVFYSSKDNQQLQFLPMKYQKLKLFHDHSVLAFGLVFCVKRFLKIFESCNNVICHNIILNMLDNLAT